MVFCKLRTDPLSLETSIRRTFSGYCSVFFITVISCSVKVAGGETSSKPDWEGEAEG